MDLNQYQAEVRRTIDRPAPAWATAEGKPTADILIHALGLTGEAGEAADLIKKRFGHDHAPDPAKLTKELGDVLWYVAALAADFGIDLDDVAQANVAKLRARYPSGFTVEASKAKADERPGVEKITFSVPGVDANGSPVDE